MTSLIHKDLSAVSGDLVEGSNDYLIIRRLKQYNTTINLDSHPWENTVGQDHSSLALTHSLLCPWSHILCFLHCFLPIIPNSSLFSHQLFTHPNLRLFRFKSAGEVHRSSACYVLLACSNHLDSLLLACTQPSFIQFESTPQPGIISW